jgi:adenylate cyclase
MRSRGGPLARASSLYEMPVTPARAQQMRELLDASAAETAALTATTMLCEYLNRWTEAGPEDLVHVEAVIDVAMHPANPRLFLAHYAKGFLHRSRGQHQEGLDEFDKTIELAPEFARAYAQKGEQYVYLGEPEKGIAEVEKALKLSPKSAVRGYFYWVIGRAHFFMERDSAAVPHLQNSVRAWSNVWYNRLYLVSAHTHARNHRSAKRVLDAFHREFEGFSLQRVREHERAVPGEHLSVRTGRDRFHDGLRRAGLPETIGTPT